MLSQAIQETEAGRGSCGWRSGCSRRNCKDEPGSPTIDGRIDPDPASMGLDDGLGDCEAKTGSGVITSSSRFLAPVEAIEDMRSIELRDPLARVLDLNGELAPIASRRDCDRASFGSVADRVLNDVEDDPL